jgi:hypothetical protein
LIGDQVEIDSIISTSGGLELSPGQFALILDPGYWDHSVVYEELIPDDALLLTINDNAFGAYGLRNEPADTIILMDDTGQTLASFSYLSDNSNGFSDEKIRLKAGDSSDNWTNSLTFLGTPGFTNSVSPPGMDLALVSFEADPISIPFAKPFLLSIVIENAGQSATGLEEIVFAMGDIDNSNPDTVLAVEELLPLQPTESTQISISLESLPPGPHRLLAWHSLNDEVPENDSLKITVAAGYPPGSVIINEFMAAPASAQSEWIELYNCGDAEVDLYGFLFADSDTACKVIISNNSVCLFPGEFLVAAEDSTVYSLALPNNTIVLIPEQGWKALNNGGDAISIFDASGSLQDMVDFSSWDIPQAVSMERIYIDGASSDPANWQPCYDACRSTPGRSNSYGTQNEPATNSASITFEPNPYDPDRHGLMEIQVAMPPDAVLLTVLIFDLRGRKLETVFDGEFPPFPIHWDGYDFEGRRLIPGLYLLFAEFRNQDGDRIDVLKKTVVVAGQL